jgi:CheY-like chemotaxis protein
VSVSVLVVDDETDVAELFRQQFRHEARQGTYVLHFAYSGEEALDKLAAGIEPQLIVILSDMNMRVMDGLELLREIKRRRPDLPVMMVTAYGDDERPAPGQRVCRPQGGCGAWPVCGTRDNIARLCPRAGEGRVPPSSSPSRSISIS